MRLIDADALWMDVIRSVDYCDDILEFIERQPTVEQSHWVPCSERLPEKEEEIYWVCTSEGAQCQCRWTDNSYGLGHSGMWGWHFLDVPQYSEGVIAWMPMPEPYQPKEE